MISPESAATITLRKLRAAFLITKDLINEGARDGCS